MYLVGTTLKVDRGGGITHYGIADGVGNVVHDSKKHRGVVRESVEGFADGGKIKIVSSITSGNPRNAVVRALSRIGVQYDLLNNNCEHFVRFAHGLAEESPQLRKYTLGTAGLVAATNSDNPLVKGVGYGMAIGAVTAPEDVDPVKHVAVCTLFGAAISLLVANR